MFVSQSWRRKAKSVGLVGWKVGEGPILSLCCDYTFRKAEGVSGSFLKVLNRCLRTPPLRPNRLPKAPPPDSLTLSIRFQHTDLGQGVQVQTFSPGEQGRAGLSVSGGPADRLPPGFLRALCCD